ncbi:hypothetical protein [Sphingomonas sp.]|uniref:hypothetical protein n=1 Tax=Sphingomonas sp. TaxID=28214 RepID=UPI003D6D2DBC
MYRVFRSLGGWILALSLAPCIPAHAQYAQGAPDPRPTPPLGIPVGPVGSISGDRQVCLYDKPTRKMICRTYDQWRIIGQQQSAKRNFQKR